MTGRRLLPRYVQADALAAARARLSLLPRRVRRAARVDVGVVGAVRARADGGAGPVLAPAGLHRVARARLGGAGAGGAVGGRRAGVVGQVLGALDGVVARLERAQVGGQTLLLVLQLEALLVEVGRRAVRVRCGGRPLLGSSSG